MGLLKRVLHDTHLPLWLIALLVGAFILRIPSFFEPLWYGDEAIYLTLGEGIRQGLLLYRDIHDNKPPLIYLIAAVAGNLFWFKVILAFSVLGATVLFWKLANLWFSKNRGLVKVATVIFALLTTIPLLEGDIANSELFILLPTLGALTILFSGKLDTGRVFISGLVMGAGPLLKVPALLDALVPIVFWLVVLKNQQKRGNRSTIWHSFVFGVGTILPLSLSLHVFALLGALDSYLSSAFLQTFDYISSWRGAPSGNADFFARNQPLFLRGIVTLIVIVVFASLYKRRKVTSSLLFISVWFALSLFATVLSERPYPHYLIQLVPGLSLLIGFAATNKTKMQFLTYPLFTLLAVTLVFFKFYYYPVFPYYENFLSWVSGNRSKDAYFDKFDKRTSRNYPVAQFLAESTNPGDHIFVWGNDPEIYVLTRVLPPTRFIAAYHINDLGGKVETLSALERQPPRFIIVTIPLDSFPELASSLSRDYTLVRQERNAFIYLKVKNSQ